VTFRELANRVRPDGSSPYADWFDSLDAQAGYRIYLAKDGESLIVLFGGGTKRRQQSDIDRAKALHAEYKARKMPPPVVGNAKKRKR
jgi:hypothetical protein